MSLKPVDSVKSAAGPPSFRGLPVPEGVERHLLYQSSFRLVVTYAMPLADLDNELKAVFSSKHAVLKTDERRNFIGKVDLELADGANLIHVLVDKCGMENAQYCQLKYWVDF